MANKILAATSLVMTYVHFQTLSNAYPFIDMFYAFVILRGCLVSIYNHAYTDPFFQSYDRMVMRESIIVDIIYIIRTNTIRSAGFDIAIAACLYIVSKFQSQIFVRNLLHALAHFMITIAHTKIVYEIMFVS